jgi:hypothetical protein
MTLTSNVSLRPPVVPVYCSSYVVLAPVPMKPQMESIGVGLNSSSAIMVFGANTRIYGRGIWGGLKLDGVWSGEAHLLEATAVEAVASQTVERRQERDFDRLIKSKGHRTVTVNRLDDGRYVLHGEFAPRGEAGSVLLSGFSVDVTALFGVMDELPE